MKIYIILTLFILTISCETKEKQNKSQLRLLNKNFSIIGRSIYVYSPELIQKEANEINLSALEFARQKKYKKAKIYIIKALSIEPKNPILLNNFGNIEDLLLNYSNAKKYYEQSLKVSDSTYLISALNLGIVHYKSGYIEKSKELFNYIISKTNDSLLIALSNLELTKVFIDFGKCNKAKKKYKKATQILSKLEVLKEELEVLKNNLNSCQN